MRREAEAGWRRSGVGGPTVEGEVAEDGRDEVQQHAEADADVGDVLHFAFGRPERHEETKVHI